MIGKQKSTKPFFFHDDNGLYLGCIGSCSFLVAIGFMGCNHLGAVICCILSVAFLGLHTCGALISHLDIASNYAGMNKRIIESR